MLSFCYAHVLQINPLLPFLDIFSVTHVRPCVQVATPLSKQLRNSPKKSFSGLQRDSNPWPLRSRCSALLAGLRRPIHQQAGQFIEFIWSARGRNETLNEMMWTASVWVFIAQLVEHCSANAKASGSNPVEAPKNIFFFGLFRNCLNCNSLRWSHIHFICIPAVHMWFHSVFHSFRGLINPINWPACQCMGLHSSAGRA